MLTDPLGLQAIPMPVPPLGFPTPWNPKPRDPDNPFDQPSNPGWKWPSFSWPSWLTPKSELDRCEEDCDKQYDRDQKLCEAWWKTTGRNPGAYRVCMDRARESYIKCYQDCKKNCGK